MFRFVSKQAEQEDALANIDALLASESIRLQINLCTLPVAVVVGRKLYILQFSINKGDTIELWNDAPNWLDSNLRDGAFEWQPS